MLFSKNTAYCFADHSLSPKKGETERPKVSPEPQEYKVSPELQEYCEEVDEMRRKTALIVGLIVITPFVIRKTGRIMGLRGKITWW